MPRKIISIRAANGSGLSNMLEHARQKGIPVNGAVLPATGADPANWYGVQSCTSLNLSECVFTLEICDAPPPVPAPPPAAAEPAPAELMREIKVLQDMVAKLSRDFYAHGAPLVR